MLCYIEFVYALMLNNRKGLTHYRVKNKLGIFSVDFSQMGLRNPETTNLAKILGSVKYVLMKLGILGFYFVSSQCST